MLKYFKICKNMQKNAKICKNMQKNALRELIYLNELIVVFYKLFAGVDRAHSNTTM